MAILDKTPVSHAATLVLFRKEAPPRPLPPATDGTDVAPAVTAPASAPVAAPRAAPVPAPRRPTADHSAPVPTPRPRPPHDATG
jgi:hypothetical protein